MKFLSKSLIIKVSKTKKKKKSHKTFKNPNSKTHQDRNHSLITTGHVCIAFHVYLRNDFGRALQILLWYYHSIQFGGLSPFQRFNAFLSELQGFCSWCSPLREGWCIWCHFALLYHDNKWICVWNWDANQFTWGNSIFWSGPEIINKCF